MDQAETFEWLRERSNRLEQVEAERDSLRTELAAAQARIKELEKEVSDLYKYELGESL